MERATDSLVGEAGGTHLLRVEHVAPVDEDAPPHRATERLPVLRCQLGPIGHEHRGVRVGHGFCDGLHLHRAVQVGRFRNRVPGAHGRPLGDETAGEHEARRFAHVVRVRLEGEPEQRDRRVPQGAEVLLELPNHPALLELVDLDHRVQELEVVAGVGGELLEGERVLWKTTPP